MITANNIREYIKENIVEPAKKKGQTTVTFRASEIHKAVAMIHGVEKGHRMANVCSAIDTDKFLDFAAVTLVKREGPVHGATVVWTFRI